jgi:hypothetical protein
MKLILISYILMTCALFGSAQVENFKFISSMKINEKQIRKLKSEKDEFTFLGTIKNNMGKSLYYIVSEYSIVHATSHGFSILYYLDKNYEVIRRYELAVPDDLPFRLFKNKLYFKYTDKMGKKRNFLFNLGISPPKLLCVSPYDCY